MTKSVLVVIPAFNEENVIGIVIDKIKRIESKEYTFKVCVVNDGSSDSTLEVASRNANILIDLPINLGVGSAVRAGYQYAQKNKYEYVIQLDADDQHDSIHIGLMLEKLKDFDHVVGSRYLNKDGYQISIIVRMAQIVVSLLMRALHGIKVSDPTSGYRASGENAITIFAKSYPTTFLQDTIGSILLVKKGNLSLVEINTPMKPRDIGESSQKTLRRVRLYLQSILLIIFWR
jgi:glycosyltransferase involved in cell wall biosynthesis